MIRKSINIFHIRKPGAIRRAILGCVTGVLQDLNLRQHGSNNDNSSAKKTPLITMHINPKTVLIFLYIFHLAQPLSSVPLPLFSPAVCFVFFSALD